MHPVGIKIKAVEQFLAERGIVLEFRSQPPVTQVELAQAEREMGHNLPEDLADLYTAFANGFELHWVEERARTDWDFARFKLPSLTELIAGYISFHEEAVGFFDNPKDFDRPDEAKRMLDRMLHWAVLWDTGGDGDKVCLDLKSGAVLFHEREWSFYDSYVNGYLIASSVTQLIHDWAQVCFVKFSGCPGDCPPHGGSAIPDYGRQKYKIPCV